jgi:hypothetical protein
MCYTPFRMKSLVAVVAVLVFAPAALAAAPGFTESPRLDPAASFVAGKAAPVFCADDFSVWLEAKRTQGFGSGNVVAYTDTSGIYLSPDICSLLHRMAAGTVTEPVRVQAVAVETLVHESIHWRTGSRDEGMVDCAAMHETPRAATRFFHVKAGKQLRAFMASAWAYHRVKPAAYQSVC